MSPGLQDGYLVPEELNGRSERKVFENFDKNIVFLFPLRHATIMP